MALQTQHPFTLRNPLSEYCEFAINGQQGLAEPLGAVRHRVAGLILELSAVLKAEAETVVHRCHPWLISVLGPRNVPLMRELTWALSFPDPLFLPHLVLGFNTVGWADNAPTFIPKLKSPKCSTEALVWDVRSHNRKIASRTVSSGDLQLDHASWEKTAAEFKAGSLIGPFYDLEDLPFAKDDYRLLRRFAI